MKTLSTVVEVRAAEAAAIAGGVSAAALMRRAGSAFAGLVHATAGAPGTALFLLGPGNNGGDGLMAAEHLAARGWQCKLWVHPRREMSRQGTDRLRVGMLTQVKHDEQVQAALEIVDVVVDALFGLGARPGLPPPIATLLRRVRAAQQRRSFVVWALDAPSGVDLETGQVDPAALVADATAMLGLPKRALYRSPALRHVGRLWLIDIGLPEPPHTGQPAILTPADVRGALPRRPRDAHKHDVGWLLVIGGADTYYGAPRLSAASALRVGAGLATVAAPAPLIPVLAGALAEATFMPLPGDDTPESGRRGAELVHQKTERYAAWLIGPGLGRGARADTMLAALLLGEPFARAFSGRAVVDADGLNWLSHQVRWWERLRAAQLVLTPHAGELARLTGQPRAAIEREPWEAARRAAEQFGQVVVLKHAFPVVAAPGHRLVVGPQSQPALASAGTGDVLAGVIAGLLAQGLGPRTAAEVGLYLAASAAERAVRRRGTLSLLAGDVVDALPATLRWFYDPIWRKDDNGWRSIWTWPAS